MADKSINYEITGDPSKLLSAQGKTIDGFKKMGDTASDSAGKINTAFANLQAQTAGKISAFSKSADGLASTLLRTTNVVGMLGTALAGLSFVNSIREQIDYADKLSKAAQKAGQSVESMSALSYAARLANVDMEALSLGMVRLSKTLLDASLGGKDSSASFAALKISVQDANGAIRPTAAVLLDVAERFAAMQDGAAKSALAMRVFGKAGADLVPFLNQGRSGIEALQTEARRLGVVISTDAANAAEQFNDNLTRLQASGQRLAMQLASDVLPSLVAITDGLVQARKSSRDLDDAARDAAGNAEFIAFLHAAAIGAARLGDVLAVIPSALSALGGSFQAVWADMSYFAKAGADLAMTPYRLITRNERGLLERMQEHVAERNRVLASANQRYADLWNKPANALEQAVARSLQAMPAQRSSNATGAAESGFTPTLRAPGNAAAPAGANTRLAQWQHELEQMKQALREKNAQEGTDLQLSLAREAQFWNSKRSLTVAASKERMAVDHQYFAAQEKASRDAFTTQLAVQKTAMAEMHKNYAAALAIADNIAAQVKARYGADAKEYANAQRELINVQRQHREQAQQLLALQAGDQRAALEATLTAQQAHAQQQFDLGAISKAQLLQQELVFQQSLHDIAVQALQQQHSQVDASKDPVASAQLHAQLLEQERRFQLQKQRLGNALEASNAQPAANVFATMQQQGNSFFTAMLTRATDWKSAMGSAFRSTGLAFVDELVTKPMLAWVMKESGMTAATTTGVAIRSAAELGGAAVSTAATAATATTNITTSAYEAAANVYKSIAAIPYVGPFLAPAMAIAATGTVLALVGKIASASGGYDIPAGVNPLVQAHAEEMILPAKYANGLRNLIATGADTDGGAGGPGAQITYNDHSGRLSPQEIRRNIGIIANALKDFAKRS